MRWNMDGTSLPLLKKKKQMIAKNVSLRGVGAALAT